MHDARPDPKSSRFGDRHLLALKRYQNIPIMSAAEAVRLLEQQDGTNADKHS
jgi:hypothetical protein